MDFSGQDLTKADLSHSVFSQCNFDNADMSEAECTGTDFTGSTFRHTNMYRLNGRNAKFAGTVFEPKDCFGITLTMDCKTFENTHISQLYWYSVLTMWSSMLPALGPVKEPLRDNLIALIGAQRYVKLKQMLQTRQL
jgi:hypothetical protein